jgi:hypothetical protein
LTSNISVKKEVEDLKRRVSSLEKLLVNFVDLDRISRSDLNSEQKKLLEKVMSDIERRDYREYLTVEQLRKALGT